MKKTHLIYIAGSFILLVLVIFLIFLKYLARIESNIFALISFYGYAAIFIVAFIVDILLQPLGPELPLIASLIQLQGWKNILSNGFQKEKRPEISKDIQKIWQVCITSLCPRPHPICSFLLVYRSLWLTNKAYSLFWNTPKNTANYLYLISIVPIPLDNPSASEQHFS